MSDATQSFDWFKTLLPLGTAFLSAILTGYFFARYKSREDQIDKRCDELCAEILNLGSISSEFWSADKDVLEQNALVQVKIAAGWTRVSGIRVLLEEFVSETSKEELLDAEVRMFSVTTGSTFGAKHHLAEPQRARESILESAHYANCVRNARMRDTKGLIRRN